MTPDELRSAARAAALAGGPVMLCLTRARPPRGERIRLTPRAGPLGRAVIARDAPGGKLEVVAYFEPIEILAFLDAAEGRGDLVPPAD